MRGDLMGSKAPRRSKNRGISTPFDDDDFSDDADDMQRLAKRLASLGLIKEARTIYSIVKNAEDYLDEKKFSDDAWDDGDTGPHYYRDPRVDEEEAAMKKERMRMQEEERRRINLDYYGHEDGNFATDRWVSNRPAWRVSQT